MSGTGAPIKGLQAIGAAVARIYAEGGVVAFWVGNGLSVAKIFPESAIKFFSYESSVCCTLCILMSMLIFLQKRFFARYIDHVEDTREISGTSRFISGGMGGISSQLSAFVLCMHVIVRVFESL
jgi:solute carrier family 25 (mitochondrial phosphate transporter), member 23/24/25/41